MAQAISVLLEHAAGWHLVVGDARRVLETPAQSAADFADEVRRHIEDLEGPRRIVLVPASASVWAVRFQPPSGPRNRQTLAYALEEQLPLAAEEFVAGYSVQEDEAFAVAAEVAVWQPLVEALAARDLAVVSVVPHAVLLAQACRSGRSIAAGTLLIWQSDDGLDVLRFAERGLDDWLHLTADLAAAQPRLAACLSAAETPVLGLNLSAEALAELQPLVPGNVETLDWDDAAGVLQLAVRVGTGKVTPWIELCRGPLKAGGPLRGLAKPLVGTALALLLLLAVWTMACWVRAAQYQQLADRAAAAQRDLYAQTFPEQTVPAAVLSRLRSEHAKLVGARARETDVELPSPALVPLYHLLVALPSEYRFRIRDLHINDGEIELDAELLTLAHVNALVAALEKEGFLVDAPATTQLSDQTLSVTIQARYPDREEAAE